MRSLSAQGLACQQSDCSGVQAIPSGSATPARAPRWHAPATQAAGRAGRAGNAPAAGPITCLRATLERLRMRLRLHQRRGGDGRIDPLSRLVEHGRQSETVRVRSGRISRISIDIAAAFLLTRYRSEFAITAIPAPIRRIVFPIQAALGRYPSTPTRPRRSGPSRALHSPAARPAPVAQLDRASVYGTEGQRFESSRARSSESPAIAGLSSFSGAEPFPAAPESVQGRLRRRGHEPRDRDDVGAPRPRRSDRP